MRLPCCLLLSVVSACVFSDAVSQRQPESAILRCLPIDDQGKKVGDDEPCPRYETTIIQLLARPEIFDGKRVIVRGYVHREFESSGIYISQEDYRDRLYHNALWVGAFKKTPRVGKCQDQYVTLEGIFRAREYGHMGMWSGMITEITVCLP